MSALKDMAMEFLAQKRIAVAGVSSKREDAANYNYGKLKEAGYEVFAVNPNSATFKGDPCYPSVKAIPGGVDAVVIVTRPEWTERIVRDCVEAGVKHVWMHNNTFGGSSVSDDAVAMCRANGIAVIPGACPMMYLQDFGHTCMRGMLAMLGRLPKVGRAAPAQEAAAR